MPQVVLYYRHLESWGTKHSGGKWNGGKEKLILIIDKWSTLNLRREGTRCTEQGTDKVQNRQPSHIAIGDIFIS